MAKEGDNFVFPGFLAVISCILRKGLRSLLKNIQVGIYVYIDMEILVINEGIDICTLAGNMTS